MRKYFSDLAPNDHARQVSAYYYLENIVPRTGNLSVLDVGCGTGASEQAFRKHNSEVNWHGVDIEDSPEVNARTKKGAQFHTFDGVTLPFSDNSFDFIISVQVFEHVRYPQQLLNEICRVLKPAGHFFGSVSYLEPYHSFSYWNYTPLGWSVLLEEAKLTPIELRPGIDGVSLITRNYERNPPERMAWFTSSPLNEEIDQKLRGRSVKDVNVEKLHYCGHLVFDSIKLR